MAFSKSNSKENDPLSGGSKKGKKDAGSRKTGGNMFLAISEMDGNAKNAKEFDTIAHADNELFFEVNGELEGEERKVASDRVDLLNWVHQNLFLTKIARSVPLPTSNTVDDTEIYHQAEHKGRKIDVGVHFYIGDNQVPTCRAFVKFADVDIDSDEFGLTIWSDHAANTQEVKKDKKNKIVGGLSKFYWTPRWNYVIRHLRLRMEAYTRDGSTAIEIVEPSAPVEEEYGYGEADDNDSTEIELPMQIPSGCTGGIIGKSGANINALVAKSGVNTIRMPERTDERPKPREMVTVTIVGRNSANQKAKVLIEAIVQEWYDNKPSKGARGAGGADEASGGFAQSRGGFGGNDADAEFGGGDSFPENTGGGDGSWAEETNAVAAVTSSW